MIIWGFALLYTWGFLDNFQTNFTCTSAIGFVRNHCLSVEWKICNVFRNVHWGLISSLLKDSISAKTIIIFALKWSASHVHARFWNMFFHRLSRLLHKQKFDEAERFARQFNLDIEVKRLVLGMELQYLQSKITILSVLISDQCLYYKLS